MNEPKPEQPVDRGRPCDGGDGYAACNMVLGYECTQCGRREAADESDKASLASRTAFAAAHGSASLPWQDVPARAGWWWWDDGDNETLMVRVVKEDGELIAHWIIPIGDSYMTCTAHVSRCLGWWAGPVEPRREKPPRVEPCRVTGAMGHLWSNPTKNGVRECLFCCERRVMAGPTAKLSDRKGGAS